MVEGELDEEEPTDAVDEAELIEQGNSLFMIALFGGHDVTVRAIPPLYSVRLAQHIAGISQDRPRLGDVVSRHDSYGLLEASHPVFASIVEFARAADAAGERLYYWEQFVE